MISLNLRSYNFWVFAKFQLLKPETSNYFFGILCYSTSLWHNFYRRIQWIQFKNLEKRTSLFFFRSFRFWNLKLNNFWSKTYVTVQLRGYLSKWFSMVVISRSIIDYRFEFFVVLVSQTSNYKKFFFKNGMLYQLSICCF